MGADDNIECSCLQSFLYIGNFLGSPKPADIVYIARKVLESVLECIEMLESKDGCRHEHRHLLAVGNSLERSADSHLSLTKAHITADKSVHRTIILHIPLDSMNSLLLIWSILIHEGRLKFLLQVGIR